MNCGLFAVRPEWVIFDAADTLLRPEPSVAHVYQQLAARYPEAKVLLSVRDPERWYQSCQSTIFASMKMDHSQSPEPLQQQMRMVRKLIVESTFGGDLDDKENALAVFARHVEEVKQTIPADRLLVYEVAQGWEPLCAFLGVDVPDTPFPRVNTTEEFQDRMAELQRLARG